MESYKKQSQGINRTCVKITSILVFLMIALFFVITKYVPQETILKIIGTNNPVYEMLCVHHIRMDDNSMKPTFKYGQIVNFDKCIDKSTINKLDTILYKDGASTKIGIIRSIVYINDDMFYKTSTVAKSREFTNVAPKHVIGVYEVD